MTSTLKQKLLAVTTMIVILTFSMPAVAGYGGKGHNQCNKDFGQKRHHMRYSLLWNDPDVAREMGLSDEQVKGIKDTDFSFREKHLEQKAELERYRLELEKAFSSEPVEKSAVMKSAQKITDSRGKMFIQEIEFRFDVEKLLTPDQVKKLNMVKKQRLGKAGKKNLRKGYGREGSFE